MQVFEKIIEKLEEKVEINERMGYMTASDVTRECIDIVKEVAEEYNNGWIPVEGNKYTLPVAYEKVLITYKTCDGTRCCEGRYNGRYWYDCETRTELKVLAWRPKPEPYQPKGE